MYEVLLHPDAQKFYTMADKALANKGEYSGLYRYRIGDYRVIYSVEDEIVQVFVVAIAHRSQAYEI